MQRLAALTARPRRAAEGPLPSAGAAMAGAMARSPGATIVDCALDVAAVVGALPG